MKDIPVSDVRTFAVMGHTGSGKTALVDALLYRLGLNDRLGQVAAGSSMADYLDEERARRISIFAKPFSGACKTAAGKTMGLVFVDTPGYMDFFGQVIAASRAVETGVIVVDAAAGVQVGTRRAWNHCVARGLSRAIVVTGTDRDNANFDGTLKAIQDAFGAGCVPVALPLPDKSGVVDVLAGKSAPEALAARVAEAKEKLIELAAGTDDALTDKFIMGEGLTPEELAGGLTLAVVNGALAPVFVCMSLKGHGLAEFLEGAYRLLPSPAAKPYADVEGRPVSPKPADPFAGFVWRTVNDPFVGQLTFVRVLGGTLTNDCEISNASKGQKERIGNLLVMNGKKQEAVAAATAGDIVAIPKLKTTSESDTLCASGQKVLCARIAFPKPVTFQAVTAKTRDDEDKIGTALARVCEEDPTLSLDRNRETKELVLQGLGDVHIDVAVGLMKSRSNVDVVLSTPKVPYRETVTGRAEGHYKHKKQSGGRGQYGEVYLRVEPKRADDAEWFEDAVVGGVIPNNFIPAVQKGVVEGMTAGTVAGYPVTDVKTTLHDGSYHEVDSSEISFKIAGRTAFKEAMTKAKPVLLEPIMTVRVMIPEQFLGDITGDLNHKRGRILGMGNESGMQVVTAEVPQAELFRYAAELRSMTAGQGTFEMEFNRYEVVPANIAQKVVAVGAKDRKEEEE